MPDSKPNELMRTTNNGKLNGFSGDGSSSEDSRSYDYPENFRKQIIALMLQQGWLAMFPDIVRPEYFNLSDERRVVSTILDHHNEYRTAPSLGDLNLMLPEDEQLAGDLIQLSRSNLTKTSDEVIEWAKDESMRIALIDSVKDWELGKYRGIRTRISEAMLTGQNVMDTGLELLANAPEWMLSRFLSGMVSVPWPYLNRRIDGGLGKGELGIMLAETGGLKSTALINVGYWAAGILNRLDVLHVTLEMSESKVLQRYGARTVLKSMDDFEDDVSGDDFRKALYQNAVTKLTGKIRVKQFPSGQLTIDGLWDYINLIRERDSFIPGMIILDYGTLMRSEKNYGAEKRWEYEEIFLGLRAMAVILDIPVWTAAQAKRASWGKWVLEKEDIGEHIGISNIADLIISLNRDADEEKLDIVRLFVAKSREAKGGCHVKCRLSYPSIIESRKKPYVKSRDEAA